MDMKGEAKSDRRRSAKSSVDDSAATTTAAAATPISLAPAATAAPSLDDFESFEEYVDALVTQRRQAEAGTGATFSSASTASKQGSYSGNNRRAGDIAMPSAVGGKRDTASTLQAQAQNSDKLLADDNLVKENDGKMTLLMSLTVSQLKEKCKHAGLSTSGLKLELVNRLCL